MEVILKEFQFEDWKEVWRGDVSADEKSVDAIFDKAFDAALSNYIGGCFPNGFGLKISDAKSFSEDELCRIYHCSGNHVRIKYECEKMRMENRSVGNRDFMIEVHGLRK